MKACIIGLGYIGLPTAIMMAAHGVDVDAVDYNENIIKTLQQGEVTFEENGLKELFQKAVKAGIRFRSDYPSHDLYVIAVPTPYLPDTKKVDAVYVVNAVKEVLRHCKEDAIIVIESTISPGTIDREIRPLVKATGIHVRLVHAPERIIPGNMIYELLHNSRTIGCDSLETGETVKNLYSTFCKGEIVLTDIKTAEMSKVVENTYRDINIAFANELAKICRSNDMDVYEVIRIANKHPRVNILQPGPGVGGHCISIDPWYLVGDYPDLAKLIRQARLVNSQMPEYVLDRIKNIMTESGISDFSKVGLYGLTYKEDVDDIRESPTLQLLDLMKAKGLEQPIVYDPMVAATVVEKQCHDFDEFLEKAEMIVILVGHTHIKKHIDRLKDKVVLDTRHIYPDAHKL